MAIFWRSMFHIVVTAAATVMIVLGIVYDIKELWIWGIVLAVAGNLTVYLLLFIIGLLMIPAARKQPSETGMNQHNIANRVKYCKKCGTLVEYSIMVCPKCGNKTYTEEKPVGISEVNNEEKVD